jgi:hypothetical protein
MNYDEINVGEVLESVASAVEQGNYRKATKKESMAVRLAAISAIVREMQVIVQSFHEPMGREPIGGTSYLPAAKAGR